jgi:ubiquinone/menaquinone biosynthesis C-methylase UbiE
LSRSVDRAGKGGRYWQNWDHGEAARRIDNYWLKSELPWRKAVTRDIRTVFGPRVPLLEVGCGTGLIYEQLRKSGVVTRQSYAGGDISQNMLNIARSRFPGVKFSELDIFKLALPDRSQKNVINVHVLQHLPHYEDAIRELLRITGETLYVVTWFNRKVDDQITFCEPSDEWDKQAFFNNYYSLPKFLGFVLNSTSRPIRSIRVHQFGPWLDSYSVALTFSDSPSEQSLVRRIRRRVGDAVRRLSAASTKEKKK